MNIQSDTDREVEKQERGQVSARRRFLKMAGTGIVGTALPMAAAWRAIPAAAQAPNRSNGKEKTKGKRQNENPKTRRPGGLGTRLRQHGPQRRPLRSGCGPGPGHPCDSRRPRARRHVLRHRGSLRPLCQRRIGRRGPRAGPQQGRHRHQVRLQDRRHERIGQPTGAYPEGRRGIVEASQDRPHRSLLPAPCRSHRADRRRGRHGQGSDQGRKGPALRPLGAEREDHSPGACRSAGCRHPDRVLADRKKPGT